LNLTKRLATESKEIYENSRSTDYVKSNGDGKRDVDKDSDDSEGETIDSDDYNTESEDDEVVDDDDDDDNDDDDDEDNEDDDDDKEEVDEEEDEDEDEKGEEDEEEERVKKEGSRRAALNKFEVKDLENEINDDEEIVYAESDSDMDDILSQDEEDNYDLDGALRWKSDLAGKAKEMFLANRKISVMELIYGEEKTPEEIASGNLPDLLKVGAVSENKKDNVEEEDDEFFKIVEKDTESLNVIDSIKACLETSNLDKWNDNDVSI
jgi:ribosome biogenesis protein BMS1